jgi:Flp pilus assembly pilin Flp
MHLLKRFLRNVAGQDLIEYSLLIVFVLIASGLILHQTGTSVTPIWVAGNAATTLAAETAS